MLDPHTAPSPHRKYQVDLWKIFSFWRGIDRGSFHRWYNEGGRAESKAASARAAKAQRPPKSARRLKNDATYVFVAPKNARCVDREDLTGKQLKQWTHNISTYDQASGKLIVDDSYVAKRAPDILGSTGPNSGIGADMGGISGTGGAAGASAAFASDQRRGRPTEGQPLQLRQIESVIDVAQALLVNV